MLNVWPRRVEAAPAAFEDISDVKSWTPTSLVQPCRETEEAQETFHDGWPNRELYYAIDVLCSMRHDRVLKQGNQLQLQVA